MTFEHLPEQSRGIQALSWVVIVASFSIAAVPCLLMIAYARAEYWFRKITGGKVIE